MLMPLKVEVEVEKDRAVSLVVSFYYVLMNITSIETKLTLLFSHL